MTQARYYTTDPITLRDENAALREQNAAALDTIAKLTAELNAANERGRMMADTIRDLTATNEHLRAGMSGLLGLRVDGPALARTLVDSVPCYDERLYDTGEQWG